MPIDVEGGVELHDKTLSWMRPILLEWQTIIREYVSASAPDDVPYHYNERANISLLCSAAWRSGFLALEEYVTRKGWGAKQANGRTDLYIGAKRSEKEICIEAKHAWITPRTRSATLQKYISKSKEDARRVYDTSDPAGCVFYCLSIPKQRNIVDIDSIIAQSLSKFQDLDLDILAWSFPTKARAVITEDGYGRRRFWPGIIVALSRVRRRRDPNIAAQRKRGGTRGTAV